MCAQYHQSPSSPKDTANIPLPGFMIYAPENHTKLHIETRQTIIPSTASTPLAMIASWSAQEATQYSNSSIFACTTPTAISTADSHHYRTPATRHPPPLRKTHPKTLTQTTSSRTQSHTPEKTSPSSSHTHLQASPTPTAVPAFAAPAAVSPTVARYTPCPRPQRCPQPSTQAS